MAERVLRDEQFPMVKLAEHLKGLTARATVFRLLTDSDTGTAGTGKPLPDDLDSTPFLSSAAPFGVNHKSNSTPSLHTAKPTCKQRVLSNLRGSLLDAKWSSSQCRQLQLPWEKPPFKPVFGSWGLVQFDPRPVERIHGGSSVETVVEDTAGASGSQVGGCETCIFSDAMQMRRSWHKPTPDMEEVARRWMCILSIDFDASSTGRLLKVSDSEAAGVKIVAQVLAGNSPTTLAKRASCVKRWIKWGKDAELSIFPLSLNFAMGYVGELCEEERYSAISEAMETFRFLKHVLGFDGCDAVIDSPWMKGAVRGAEAAKGERKQSRVLTAEEVLALEKLVINKGASNQDLYAAGIFLFMIYSRARVSDCRAVSSVEIDLFEGSGFLEVRTMEHKNKRYHGKSGQALILVAPSHGLRTQSWLAAFVEIAKAVGLPLDHTRRGPLLPAVDESGRWTDRPTSANEVSRWLVGLIEVATGKPVSRGLTSHGMKATTLAWMAKAGVSETTRLILGHHSLKKLGTLETYSRDMQSGPLREFAIVLKSIRDGTYLPDATRSGMYPERTEPLEEAAKIPISEMCVAEMSESNPRIIARVPLGLQPRGRKVPPLVPEFRCVVQPPAVKSVPPIATLPVGSRRLRACESGGIRQDEASSSDRSPPVQTGCANDPNNVALVNFGISWTPH